MSTIQEQESEHVTNEEIEALKEILERQWGVVDPVIELNEYGDYLVSSVDGADKRLQGKKFRGGTIHVSTSLPQKEEEIYQQLLNLTKEI